MIECTNYRPWDTETPSHKISHDEYYENRGTTDKTKHKPSMLQPPILHPRITTRAYIFCTYWLNHGCGVGEIIFQLSMQSFCIPTPRKLLI